MKFKNEQDRKLFEQLLAESGKDEATFVQDRLECLEKLVEFKRTKQIFEGSQSTATNHFRGLRSWADPSTRREHKKGMQSFLSSIRDGKGKGHKWRETLYRGLDQRKNSYKINTYKQALGYDRKEDGMLSQSFRNKDQKLQDIDKGSRNSHESFTSQSYDPEFMIGLLSLQTHLVIESRYFIPDFETHLSSKLMINEALDKLHRTTSRVRQGLPLIQEDFDIITDLINWEVKE